MFLDCSGCGALVGVLWGGGVKKWCFCGWFVVVKEIMVVVAGGGLWGDLLWCGGFVVDKKC